MRVLCIDGNFESQINRPSFANIVSFPLEGREYTVEKIVEIKGKTGYVLTEVFGGIFNNMNEISWDNERFLILKEFETKKIKSSKTEDIIL